MLSINQPLVICAAITGGGSPKKRSPIHPVSHEEIVREAVACGEAGATIVHLHARDENGQATMSVPAYKALAADIRAAASNVILNFSAGDNGGRATHADRVAVVGAGAEMVSFGAGSFNTSNRLYDNGPKFIDAMLGQLKAKQVLPEIEIFDVGQLGVVVRLLDDGLIPKPASVQFVFGIPGGMPSRIGILEQMLEQLPRHCHWSICCQSNDYALWREMMLYAFLRGGHIRTGMEDVVYKGPETLATSNAELVSQWVKTAEIWGRSILRPDELRQQLGLPLLEAECTGNIKQGRDPKV